jgi:hypothetical protein
VFRLIAVVLLVASLATGIGCGIAPSRPVESAALPMLQLAPSALPEGLALEQRLTFTHGDRRETVDALVESDAQSVRVVVHAQGQVALRLVWDGKTLEETRAEWLPPTLQSARVLSDLQFAYWPLAAINDALPDHWEARETDGVRRLVGVPDSGLAIDVGWPEPGVALLTNHRDGYELRIESQPVTP